MFTQDQTIGTDKLNSYRSIIIMNIFIVVILVPKHASEDPKIDFVCPVLWEKECYYLINSQNNSDNEMDPFDLILSFVDRTN